MQLMSGVKSKSALTFEPTTQRELKYKTSSVLKFIFKVLFLGLNLNRDMIFVFLTFKIVFSHVNLF